jgi:hypothetical protein
MQEEEEKVREEVLPEWKGWEGGHADHLFPYQGTSENPGLCNQQREWVKEHGFQ